MSNITHEINLLRNVQNLAAQTTHSMQAHTHLLTWLRTLSVSSSLDVTTERAPTRSPYKPKF